MYPTNFVLANKQAAGRDVFLGVPDMTDSLAAGGDTNMDIEAPIANTFQLGDNSAALPNLSEATPADQNLTMSQIWEPVFDSYPY